MSWKSLIGKIKGAENQTQGRFNKLEEEQKILKDHYMSQPKDSVRCREARESIKAAAKYNRETTKEVVIR